MPSKKLQMLWQSMFSSAEIQMNVVDTVCMKDPKILVAMLGVGAWISLVVQLNPKTQFLQADASKRCAGPSLEK